jgi:hypothetical protein
MIGENMVKCDACSASVYVTPLPTVCTSERTRKLRAGTPGWELDLESGYACCPDCVEAERWEAPLALALAVVE